MHVKLGCCDSFRVPYVVGPLIEGVSVTTVILAPGACGGGLRGALPDAISPSPVVPLVNSKNADLMRRHRT